MKDKITLEDFVVKWSTDSVIPRHYFVADLEDLITSTSEKEREKCPVCNKEVAKKTKEGKHYEVCLLIENTNIFLHYFCMNKLKFAVDSIYNYDRNKKNE